MRAALLHPSVPLYDALQLTAGGRAIAVRVGVTGALIGAISNVERALPDQQVVAALWGLVTGPIVALMIFGIVAVVLHAAARMFGGTGDLTRYGYLLSLFGCPLIALAVCLGGVPLVGSVATYLATIYAFVLVFVATLSAHRLSTVRAVLALTVAGLALGVIAIVLLVLTLISFVIN